MSLIKLSAGNDQYWLLDDVPHQRGQFDISAKIGQEVVEIFNLATLKSVARGNFDEFSPDGTTPYASTQALIDDLKTFFFRSLAGGGGGSVTSVNGDAGPVVVLDADDISDTGTANKYATQSELDQISTNATNIGGNTTSISSNTTILNRLNGSTTVTSTATLTPDIDSNSLEQITAQAAGLTVAAPTGTPFLGQKLVINITDNGTARAIAWSSIYNVVGVTLPVTTTISKSLYVGCIYNSNTTNWDVVAVKEEV